MTEIYNSERETKNYSRMMKKMNKSEKDVDFMYAYDGLEIDI